MQTSDQPCPARVVQRRRQQRRTGIVEGQRGRERRPDHHAIEIGQYVIARRAIAAPPRGDVRQRQIGAVQHSLNAGQEGKQRTRLQDSGANRVDDGRRTMPDRLGQAGRADPGFMIEFKGIHEGGVEASPEHAERPRPLDGAHHHPPVGDHEVVALEQHQAEVAGDVGVLEIGFVALAGCQDCDAAVSPAGECEQRIAQIAEEAGQTMDIHGREEIGERPHSRDAVL